MKIFLIISVLVGTFLTSISCEKGETRLQKEDKGRLEKMRQEILDKTTGIPCNNPEEWSFSALGSKACGGPQEYIAYPLTTDTDELLVLIEQYTKAEEEYNKKYRVISDCMAILAPSHIECDNGQPKLVYSEIR